MSTLELRQIGDAVVLILPNSLLQQLNAKVGDSLEYTFEEGKLVIKKKKVASKTSKVRLECVADQI